MSNSNNIPITWDSEGDNSLLGSLFPAVNEFPIKMIDKNNSLEGNPFGKNSVFSKESDAIKELERNIGNDNTIQQTLLQNKRNSADGFYYFHDGTFLGNYGTSNVVVLCEKMTIIHKSKTNQKEYIEFKKPIRLSMTNAELNMRAFMSTLKQAENHGNSPLPYNAKHGFTDGKLNVFTEKSYQEAKEDYANHPYENSKGSTPAGAYQLLASTYKSQKKRNPLVIDFGPDSQDYAVIGIFKSEGIDAFDFIKAGNLDKAVQKLTKDKWGNTQFASLPGGGQEAKGMDMNKVKLLFKQNIANELGEHSNISIAIGEATK